MEQELLDKEKKTKEKEVEKGLLKGSPQLSFKKGYFADQSYGVDRFKDIREGQSKKLGLMDKHKRDGQKRPIDNYEVSYNLS